MTKPLRVDGIDISNWQKGTLDLGAAKKAGCRFLFHKATEGTGYHDPNYATRRTQAKRAGIPFGAYHFARPTRSSGVAQARYFLAYAKPAKGDMRPMLDLEDQAVANWSPAKLTAWVKSFVGEVVKQTGVPPFIYTRFTLTDTFDCPLWVASYANDNRTPHVPAPWKTWTVWQFSDGVYGWPNSETGVGHVDLNTMNGDPAHLIDVFTLGYAAPKPPAPRPPAPKPPAPRPKPPVPHVDPPLAQLRCATLNVNQFHSPAAATQDLAGDGKQGRPLGLLRRDDLDVIAVEECCELDLHKIAAQFPGWAAFQDTKHRGRANTGVLYRTSLPVKGGRYVPYIDSPTDDLGARFLAEILFAPGVGIDGFAAGHRSPTRDKVEWGPSDKVIRAWAKGRRVILGIDSNCHWRMQVWNMQRRTGLSFVHVGMDGFLTNLPLLATSLRDLPKCHSDHLPVAATFNL